jgi:prevent-host-death family protein
MRHTVAVTDAARRFAEYLHRVEANGERFVVTRGDRPVAELVPFRRGASLRELPAMLAALPRLSPEEAAGYGEEIDAARAELADVPLDHAGWDDRYQPAADLS